MKAELREGDVLVVWESSRAGRDLAEHVALRQLCSETNVPLSYSGRILDLSKGDDRFVGGLDALVAERESEQIKERVLRGKRSAATAGRPSTRPPWGYRLVRPGVWEFDPVEAPRVRDAVERLLAGESMYSVMRHIETTEGFTPSSLTNLKRALTNPALAGLRVHRGKVVGNGTWEPLISEDQHRTLTRQLARMAQTNGYTSTPGPEPKYLLTGIATCKSCGEGLRYKVWSGKRRPGYVCYRGHCSRVAHEMDATAEKALFRLIPLVFMARDAMGVERDDRADNAAAQRQIEALEEKREEWTQAAIRGDVSPDAFAKIEKGLLAQIAELEPKTAPMDLEKAREVEAMWPEMPMRERRQWVRRFLTVTVVPAKRKGTRTGQVLIEPGQVTDRPEGTFLSYLTFRESSWWLRTPLGDELDLADADKAAELAAKYRQMA
jgi:site-specific DNA recombinase